MDKTELQIQAKAFWDNKPMRKAIHYIMMRDITNGNPDTNWVRGVDKALPNWQYGEQVKAIDQALELLSQAFDEIQNVSIIEKQNAYPLRE